MFYPGHMPKCVCSAYLSTFLWSLIFMTCLLCRSPGVEMVDLKYCRCVLPFFPCRAAETIDQMLEKLLEYVDNVIVSQGGGCFKFSYTDISLPFSFPPSLLASLLLPFSFPPFLFPSSFLPSHSLPLSLPPSSVQRLERSHQTVQLAGC